MIQILPTKTMDLVVKELKTLKKDAVRKVCKQCHELGHGISSVHCAVNIDQRNRLRQKIKRYMLSQTTLDTDCFLELSTMLTISLHQCKTLYNEIPMNELLDRKIDFIVYLKQLEEKYKYCHVCHSGLLEIQTNTIRLWKGNELCDPCWSNHKDYRDALWDKIKTYREIQCVLCNKNNPNERYHYDHLNMFDKEKSICSMINEGQYLEDMYKEIDKCQILCLSCHHIVTDIEHKLLFTRIKQSLTRRLHQGEITEEDYNTQKEFYQPLYESKMNEIYCELKRYFSQTF
jgi:hypothetical protein